MLPQYTLISAFQDSRFAPIKLTDFEGLDVSVSLLVDFITRKDPYDWKVGTHGINMKLKKGGIQYSSTFLPEVAEEQGWDKKETLKNLLYKAGC